MTTTLASTTACWSARSGTGPRAHLRHPRALPPAPRPLPLSARQHRPGAGREARQRAARPAAGRRSAHPRPGLRGTAPPTPRRRAPGPTSRASAADRRPASVGARGGAIGAVGRADGARAPRRRWQRRAPAHTVTRSRMSASVASPMPSTSSSSSTLVKAPLRAAPVEDRLAGHRADAGQGVELLEGGGVDVDRAAAGGGCRTSAVGEPAPRTGGCGGPGRGLDSHQDLLAVDQRRGQGSAR